MKELDLGEMFAAGAKSFASERGMCEKDAEAFADSLRKEARSKRVQIVDDDEEEESWWDRNKFWVLPAAIGTGAFIVGADAGRNGRPDRGYLSNALGLFGERLKALFGINDSSFWKSLTHADKNKLPEGKADREKGKRELSELLGIEGDKKTGKGGAGAFPLTLDGRMPFEPPRKSVSVSSGLIRPDEYKSMGQ